jgi:hypothetical protein
MDKKWCCQEFESHATVIPSEDGFRVVLVWSKTHFLSLLEFRSSNKQPLDSSEGGMKIWFCPWCGRNLEQHYSSIKVQISRWSQWVDATLSSNPPCIENKS